MKKLILIFAALFFISCTPSDEPTPAPTPTPTPTTESFVFSYNSITDNGKLRKEKGVINYDKATQKITLQGALDTGYNTISLNNELNFIYAKEPYIYTFGRFNLIDKNQLKLTFKRKYDDEVIRIYGN